MQRRTILLENNNSNTTTWYQDELTWSWESGPRVAPSNVEIESNMTCDRELIAFTVPKAE